MLNEDTRACMEYNTKPFAIYSIHGRVVNHVSSLFVQWCLNLPLHDYYLKYISWVIVWLKKTIWKYFLFICKKGWFIVLSKKKKKFREVDRSSWAMVTKAQLLNIHNQKTYNQHIITTSTLISKERSQKKMAPLDNNF